jgi:hypothetical protein
MPDMVEGCSSFDKIATSLKQSGALVYVIPMENTYGTGLCMREQSPWTTQDDLFQVALYIPGNHMLTVKNILEQSPEFENLLQEIGSYPEEWSWDERPVLALFLLMLRKIEVMNSKFARFWRDYLELLPKSIYLPIRYDSQDLESIYHTNLFRAVQARKRSLSNEYALLSAWWEWEPRPTLDEWTYVNELLWTRGMGIPDEIDDTKETMTIVPLMDFVNHSLDANGKWILQSTAENQEGGIFLVVDRDLGDREILVSYGAKSNEELLFQYGFAIPDNPYDRVMMDFNIDRGDEEIEQKIAELNHMDAWPPVIFLGKAQLHEEYFSTVCRIAAIVSRRKGMELSLEDGRRLILSKASDFIYHDLPARSQHHRQSSVGHYLVWYLEGQRSIYQQLLDYPCVP